MNIFKVGDWVTFFDITCKNPKQIIRIDKDVLYTNNNKCLMSQAMLWQPKAGELCWFSNNAVLLTYPAIATFERMLNESFDTDIGPFDHCEPYLGELPSFLKEIL